MHILLLLLLPINNSYNHFKHQKSLFSFISLYTFEMDAKLFTRSMSPPFITPREGKCFPISSVLNARPAYDMAAAIDKNLKTTGREVNELIYKNKVYSDTWFDKMAIDYLSRSLQATTGMSSSKSGYDSLLEAAKMVARNFNPNQQHELILHALERAFPRMILSMIRILLPQSKLTREVFAVFTTVFFSWLVGPSEVRETELNGRREKSVVHIRKCRFLEQTNCVGMCTNLCKIPSQTFIKETLGIPVNMIPNFDDISCEMIFGQDPPAPTDDPAFKQPCFKLYAPPGRLSKKLQAGPKGVPIRAQLTFQGRNYELSPTVEYRFSHRFLLIFFAGRSNQKHSMKC